MEWTYQYGWSLPLLSFNLSCGRKIDIMYFEVIRTYGGLLEGDPTKRINAQMIDRRKYPYADSDRTVKSNLQIIPGEMESRCNLASRERCLLPPVYLSLSLESAPFDENEAFSYMTVLYFCELNNFFNLELAIESIRKELNWNEYAIDGCP